MNTTFYVLHMYVTRILLVTGLAYAFLTHGCPTCQGRLESNSPTFFSDEGSTRSLEWGKNGLPIGQNGVKKNPNIEIEAMTEEENHA